MRLRGWLFRAGVNWSLSLLLRPQPLLPGAIVVAPAFAFPRRAHSVRPATCLVWRDGFLCFDQHAPYMALCVCMGSGLVKAWN